MANLPDLVVEDGTCVDGANTFVTIDELKDFACLQLNGANLLAKIEALSEDDQKRILLAAMEKICCENFCGNQKCDLPFPRTGCQWSDLVVPAAIKKVQMLWAIELCAQVGSGSTSAATGGVVVKSMKIKDNSFTFKDGALVTFGDDECSPQISEVGETATALTSDDKISCLLAPFRRKKVNKVGSLRICR